MPWYARPGRRGRARGRARAARAGRGSCEQRMIVTFAPARDSARGRFSYSAPKQPGERMMSDLAYHSYVEGECRRLERERLSMRRAAQHHAAWLAMHSARRSGLIQVLAF